MDVRRKLYAIRWREEAKGKYEDVLDILYEHASLGKGKIYESKMELWQN